MAKIEVRLHLVLSLCICIALLQWCHRILISKTFTGLYPEPIFPDGTNKEENSCWIRYRCPDVLCMAEFPTFLYFNGLCPLRCRWIQRSSFGFRVHYYIQPGCFGNKQHTDRTRYHVFFMLILNMYDSITSYGSWGSTNIFRRSLWPTKFLVFSRFFWFLKFGVFCFPLSLSKEFFTR